MQTFQRIKSDKKTYRLILFVLFCVIASRILIYAGFLFWKDKNSLDIGFWEAMSRFDLAMIFLHLSLIPYFYSSFSFWR